MAEDKNRLHAMVEGSGDEVIFWRPGSLVSWITEEHSHFRGQLFSLESGLAVLETKAGIWTMPPGRCAWIPPGQWHFMRSCGNIGGWSIYLAPSLCDSLPMKPAILSLSPLLREVVFRISDWNHNSPTATFRRNLLAVLCEEIRNSKQQPLHLPMPTDPRLRRLAEEMPSQLERERDLDEWARFIGMSKRSLLRKFQQETGMTVGQWRQHLRLLVPSKSCLTGARLPRLASPSAITA